MTLDTLGIAQVSLPSTAREPLDGQDNDGNGVVDDWNGPTYAVDLRPTQALMQTSTRFLQSRLATQMAYDKGEILDLRFGFDTSNEAA